jgi:cell division protein FtsQ
MSFHSLARPMFLPLGLRVETVRLSARGSWSLRLDDGTEIEAGRGDPQARLARFARMLPQLRNDPARRLVRADLRYTNGFAIVWEETAPPPPATEPAAPAAAVGSTLQEVNA